MNCISYISFGQIENINVKNLISDSLKNIFLEYIFDREQNSRRKSLIENYSYNINDSLYIEAQKNVLIIDSINIHLIDEYLTLYGYPIDLSIKSKLAPITVIHHSDLNNRLKHFSTLKQAFKLGLINESYMSLYLCRTILYFKKQKKIDNTCFDKNINDLIDEVNEIFESLK
ncbi:MAG: hypothetical protein HYU67_07780 [Flavobacteriia bacterium]|nr:hypothetical protein [Flavobacteriia bacterium]